MSTQSTNSLGMTLMPIPAGTFLMGSGSEPIAPDMIDHDYGGPGHRHGMPNTRTSGEYDEYPQHPVTISRPFLMSATPVTNAQYEVFDPDHRRWRGYLGFSAGDDDAVVNVSWHQAVAFCDWLAAREGQRYRLPTEAEWEYAARAGSTTTFWTGDSLPVAFHRNQRMTWYPDPTEGPYDPAVEHASLQVGTTPANPWGLHDVHGLVEEWCLDWYGPYGGDAETDPIGAAHGDFRVSRGGSHSTEVYFLRAANRQGSLPEDFSWLIGFRVVVGDLPANPSPRMPQPSELHRDVGQQRPAVAPIGDRVVFTLPKPYVKIPADSHGPLFSQHNHCPSIVECPNGDLLAVWFSCETEAGREMTLVGSRLRHGSDTWDDASLFWEAPDRNMTAGFFHREGDALHFYGALGTGGTWGQMIIYHRISTDSGVTWSAARIVVGDHTNGQTQPANVPFRTRDGTIVVPGDDNAVNGSRLYISRDNGATWHIPEGRMAGIHVAVAENDDGEVVAFGRMFRPDSEKMPKSVSRDLGERFEVTYTDFDSVKGGQRPVMLMLQEGPLMLCSFSRDMTFEDSAGGTFTGTGLYAALSWDGGETWPTRRLVTVDEGHHELDGGGWTRSFDMTPTTAEPKGYLTATQAADGTIHLISSRLHYTFSYGWLTSPVAPRHTVVGATQE